MSETFAGSTGVSTNVTRPGDTDRRDGDRGGAGESGARFVAERVAVIPV